MCEMISSNVGEFLCHLKTHFDCCFKVSVLCPYKRCGKIFTVKSSFTSHLSRKHRNWQVSTLSNVHVLNAGNDGVSDTLSETEPVLEHIDDMSEPTANDPSSCDSFNSMQELTDSIALFFLKMQSKYLLPTSTLDVVVDELGNLSDQQSVRIKDKIAKALAEAGIDPCVAQRNAENISAAVCLFNKASNPLRSNHTRQQFYAKNFKFVKPLDIYLSTDDDGIRHYCHYVPIKDTLKVLLEDASFNAQFANPEVSPDGTLFDINDGNVVKTNNFFQSNPQALKIILFQDAFEIVNPIGSAKKTQDSGCLFHGG